MLKLKEGKLFSRWCESVFEASDNDLHVPGCLFSMVSMVERGARLATTTLPPVLSKCLRLPSAYLHEVEQVQQWMMQPLSQCLLHIGGMCSKERGWMDPLFPPASVSQALTVFFAKKTVILIGFEEDVLDYSLLAFLNSLAPLQGSLAPSIVMLSQKGQTLFPLPVPVFTLKMDPSSSDSDYLKDATELFGVLDGLKGPTVTPDTSVFKFLYVDGTGEAPVPEQLQRCWDIMLSVATIDKMEAGMKGVGCVGVRVPSSHLHRFWDSIVNKKCLSISCSLLAVFVGKGPIISLKGSLASLKAQSTPPTVSESGMKPAHLSYTNGRTPSVEDTSPHSGKSAGVSTPTTTSASKEVHIETIDRGRPLPPQLTPTAIVSPGINQFSWRPLQSNGQLILMPSPAQSVVAQSVVAQPEQMKLHRPPAPSLRRSSAIDKEDDSLEIDGPLTGINLERVHGPFVAEPSVPAGEGYSDLGEIKLVHKWMERKEKHRLSHQGSSTQSIDQQSFDEEQKASKSSPLHSSPITPSPSTAHHSPISAMPPLTTVVGSTATPTLVAAQPTNATFPMSIPSNAPGFINPALSHAQTPLIYAQGMPGAVLVANPYQQWSQGVLPGYMVPVPHTPGTPVMTAAHTSRVPPQTSRVSREQQQAGRPSSGSPLYKQPKQDPELVSSGLKRTSRLSSSLPDISQVSNAKKPKHEPLVGVSNMRPGSGCGIDKHPMIHSSSVPEDTRGRMLSLQPRKQMSEDTELAEITGGPLYMYPMNQEGSKLPPFPVGRGVVQLWQFLLDLLLSQDNCSMIHWTGDQYEFRIVQPDEIARLWGKQKNKPQMNYDKLSRGLRYYYAKGIMDKVPGKKLTFRFTCDVEEYVQSRSKHPNSVEMLRNLIKKSSTYAQQY
jgi:c-ets proto-oncogene protein